MSKIKKTYNIFQKNPKKVYEGSHYAIQGSGGFVIKDSYSVQLSAIQKVGKYDMTDAVQLLFPADHINRMLGGFNSISGRFFKDSITISANQLVSGLDKEHIISVGSLDSIYYDYQKYINSFFGYSLKGSSLFTNESQVAFGNGVFDKSGLYAMLKEKTICPYSGEVKDGLSGYIEIHNIGEILMRINQLDLFGNRVRCDNNIDISQGFIAGDLIYISEGINIKLDLGLSLDSGVIGLLENTFMTNSGISSVGLAKKYKAPLLLRLV
jgi:hypothetical protein